jgi:hypothetical protein
MSRHTIISAAECKTWTDNWLRQQDNTNPYTFFLHEKSVQTGVIFRFDSLRYLFSTPGIVTIKVRFGLREFTTGRDPEFHLILSGFDKTNTTRITPYFTSSAFTHHHHYQKSSKAQGNLPQALMKLWKKSWRKKVRYGVVDRKMFCVSPAQLNPDESDFLQGYNYSVQEMMNALGTFPGVADIHFKFGLHKHYNLDEGLEAKKFRYTFGLILYAAVQAVSDLDPTKLSELRTVGSADYVGANDSTVIDESGYYDFTAPCPHTC